MERSLEETTLRQAHKCIYWAWKAMKQRCQNPRCKAFCNYGMRGIKVCPEWQNFEPFCEWALSSGYQRGLELDRIDNDGDYCPENCRWTTRRANINNRRKTIMLTVNAEKRSRTEWEDLLKLPKGIVKAWVTTHGKSYAEERLDEVIRCGYKERDFARGHQFAPVRCIETGCEFLTITNAAKSLNVTFDAFRHALDANKPISGYHFIRV